MTLLSDLTMRGPRAGWSEFVGPRPERSDDLAGDGGCEAEPAGDDHADDAGRG